LFILVLHELELAGGWRLTLLDDHASDHPLGCRRYGML